MNIFGDGEMTRIQPVTVKRVKGRGQELCPKRPAVTQGNIFLSSLLIPGVPLVNQRVPICFQERFALASVAAAEKR